MKEQEFEKNENNMKLERKFIPGEFAFSANKDGLGDFLKKRLSGSGPDVFTIPTRGNFFADTSSYSNPLREVSTCLTTKYESLEIPFFGCKAGINDEDLGDVNQARSVVIEMKRSYASTNVAMHMAEKIQSQSHGDLIKGYLASEVSNLERESFINDPRKGIIKILDGDNKIKKVETSRKDLANHLMQLKFDLNVKFRQNGTFLMSSDLLREISLLKDDLGRYIFDGDSKLFGKNVIVMDEMKNNILFGDFKQGYIIVDMDEAKISSRSIAPGMVELSLPLSTGAAVVMPEAIVGMEIKFPEEKEEIFEEESSNVKKNKN